MLITWVRKVDLENHYDHFKQIFYKVMGSVLQNLTMMINNSLIFLIYQEVLVSQEISLYKRKAAGTGVEMITADRKLFFQLK